jgi:GH24 family phage-related lysozyme (muramidase)
MIPNDCEVANGKKEDEFWASSLTTVRRTNGHVPFSLRGRAHTSICVREINEANAAAACRSFLSWRQPRFREDTRFQV